MTNHAKNSQFTVSTSLVTFLRFSFLFSLLFIPTWAMSQEVRENEKGEKIIVHSDGTWQYFADYLSGEEDRNPASDTEGTNSYPIFDGTIEPLEGNIRVTEEDLFKIAVRRAQLAESAAKVAQMRWDKAHEARVAIEKELQQMLSRSNANDPAIQQLKTRLAAAKRTEAESQVESQDALRESDRANFLTQKGEFVVAAYKETQRKRLEREAARRQSYTARSYEQSLPLTENYVGLDRQDLILNPPQEPCAVAFEGIDPKSNNFRKNLERQFLFSHTDDRLRVFLKGKEYLRCEGYFSADGGYRYLTLEFTFAYPNAQEAYGFIEKGSPLTIKMLNGDFVNLRSGTMDRGSYDTQTELLSYQVYYPIDRSQISFLKNSEVDAIRVFWSSGFEEYEVYQLDFFSTQLRCID